MWPSHLSRKIFLVYAVLLAILAAGIWLAFPGEQATRRQAQRRLHDTAILLRELVVPLQDANSHEQLQNVLGRLAEQTETRLTVIGADGRVWADSDRDPSRMQNHLTRPEVQAALLGDVGAAQRRSATLGIEMLYVAVPLTRAGTTEAVVRVAMPAESLRQAKAEQARTLALLTLLVLLLGWFAVGALVRRLQRPLDELSVAVEGVAVDSHEPLELIEGRDPVGGLAAAINRLQRQLAQRLKQSRENNERLATVLRSMVEGVIVVGPDERILLANDAGRRLLDFSATRPEGRALVEVTRVRPVHEAVAEVLQKGRTYEREFDTTGTVRRVLALRAARLPEDFGRGVVVVLHDVTELRRLENLRRELVANVSHELKTPLASIKAYAETLRMGAMTDPEHGAEFLARIEEQADRLHQLILDLLQIARVESGEQVFDITEVALNDVVQQCVLHYDKVAAAKDIELISQPPQDSVTVRADEEGLRTILNNLLDNAVKYTPAGGRVTVAWHTTDDRVVLEVRDTGIGIAAVDQGRIFERFYRADKARSRELGGTGLGLSIVKHLVQAFQGSVRVESALRQGSVFRVELPRG